MTRCGVSAPTMLCVCPFQTTYQVRLFCCRSVTARHRSIPGSNIWWEAAGCHGTVSSCSLSSGLWSFFLRVWLRPLECSERHRDHLESRGHSRIFHSAKVCQVVCCTSEYLSFSVLTDLFHRKPQIQLFFFWPFTFRSFTLSLKEFWVSFGNQSQKSFFVFFRDVCWTIKFL